jgi:hypothetical protein
MRQKEKNKITFFENFFGPLGKIPAGAHAYKKPGAEC